MSFGFSIGDIVLLGQLSYKLYTSASSAPREVGELAAVLSSLKFALGHLEDAADDILAKADGNGASKGPALRKNLNEVIESCGATLIELEKLMKKYREVTPVKEGEPQREKQRWDQKLKINWLKLRWNEDKATWEEYTERLRAHLNAIELIMSLVMWSQIEHADAASRKGHEKTHELLNQVLENPGTDDSLSKMVQEIHQAIHAGPGPPAPGSSPPGTSAPAAMQPTLGPSTIAPIPAASSAHIAGVRKLAMRTTAIPRPAEPSPPPVTPRPPENIPVELPHSPEKLLETQSSFPPILFKSMSTLPPALVELNNERRAYAAREYNEFTNRHKRQTKPSFRAVEKPSAKQLSEDLSYIFKRQGDAGKTPNILQIQHQTTEMSAWIQAFENCVKDFGEYGGGGADLIELLITLNRALEQSETNTRSMFYQSADHMELPSVLEQLHSKSKSVRILKEIEEFQDAREDWEEGEA